MIERFWPEVPEQFITANGTADGHLTVTSTLNLKVKQIIYLKSNALQPIELEIRRINSETDLEVGLKSTRFEERYDVSGFLVSDQAAIYFLEKQTRPAIPPDSYERAVYEEEPTVAKRVILVDTLGRRIDKDNPLPTVETGLFSKPYDRLKVMERDEYDNPTLIKSFYKGVETQLLHITYDEEDNWDEVFIEDL